MSSKQLVKGYVCKRNREDCTILVHVSLGENYTLQVSQNIVDYEVGDRVYLTKEDGHITELNHSRNPQAVVKYFQEGTPSIPDVLFIEVGKTYLDEEGDSVKIIHQLIPNKSYSFVGICTLIGNPNEQCVIRYDPDGLDFDETCPLVSEVPSSTDYSGQLTFEKVQIGPRIEILNRLMNDLNSFVPTYGKSMIESIGSTKLAPEVLRMHEISKSLEVSSTPVVPDSCSKSKDGKHQRVAMLFKGFCKHCNIDLE